MMGRCETCRWWTQDFGQCLLLSETPLYQATVKMPPTLVDRKAKMDQLALTIGLGQGSEGSYLDTAPDFGCVQHDPREDMP